MHRIMESLRRIPGHVWIIIGIGAVGLVIAYLSYRAQANNAASSGVTNGTSVSNAAVPAGGSSTPNYASDAGAYGGYGYDYTSYELQQILALLQMQQAQVPASNPPTPVNPVHNPVDPLPGGMPGPGVFHGNPIIAGAPAPVQSPAIAQHVIPGTQGGFTVKMPAVGPISVSAARAGANLAAAAPAPRTGTVAALAGKMRSVNRLGA